MASIREKPQSSFSGTTPYFDICVKQSRLMSCGPDGGGVPPCRPYIHLEICKSY